MTHFLSKIILTQFRSYLMQQFDFAEKVVAIYGNNGSGKTNLLDAIYYLCFTKSYFSKPDAKSALKGYSGFRIEGYLDPQIDLACIVRETGKKEFSIDGIPYKKFSEHIGKFPCVMIAPDDVETITGGSELRRKYIDAMLSQINPTYLQTLIKYTQLLQQRNALLKEASAYQSLNIQLLEVIDEQMATLGTYIYRERVRFWKEAKEIILMQYTHIAGEQEALSLKYSSQLDADISFLQILKMARNKDAILQRTTQGVHKDDWSFELNEAPFKQVASQGQRKSLLFALKLAEYILLKKYLQKTPLLLLDDVFEKLDKKRMNNLLQFVCTQNDGQVFITDTHKERLETILSDLKINYQLVHVCK